MHLYNAWLPPPVAEEAKKEADSFSRVVSAVKSSYNSDDVDSVYSTLKWLSVIDLFIKARSDVSMKDVSELIEFGLEVFLVSENKIYVQMGEYPCEVTQKVSQEAVVEGPEGWRLRQRNFEATTSLVHYCQKFFPQGSAAEIWFEFRLLLENPWHNSAFEGSGFVRLFLPTNSVNQEFFTHDWIKELLHLWDSIPNCQFWNSQWTGLIAQVVKKYRHIDWDGYLPILFARYLNMFEVPVAKGSGSYPFSVSVPGYTKFLFSNRTGTPAEDIAKSIVYLLKPGSSVLEHFEKMVNLLEHWTYSLERFLLHLVTSFQKRLEHEQLKNKNILIEQYLGKSERQLFVKLVMKLIDRGQYSKNEHLSRTVAAATSILSYVEPSLILPFVASRFHMALETMTATHQLRIALMSVAVVGRSLLLESLSNSTVKPMDLDSGESSDEFIDLLMVSLSNALFGIDANDPPKTLATMQLVGSIFSNMSSLDDEASFMPMICFSEWLDEFFCRLFSLLLHLEPSGVTSEGLHSSATSGTFLVEDGSYYYCLLDIMFGRLSKPLYNQALKKISKFVKINILPGAIAEVGLLCCACVYSNPEEAVTQLIEPILLSVISSLKGCHLQAWEAKPTISPALETAIVYQLKILSFAITYGGPALLQYKDQFKEAILSASEAPSWKVNGGGSYLLRSLLGSLVLYYPIDQYKCIRYHPNASALEEWISSKDYSEDKPLVGPKWHVSCAEEVNFANELLDLHLRSALDDLQMICQTQEHSGPGDEKEHLKVTLLRICSSLEGVSTCLPDFSPSSKVGTVESPNHGFFLIAGATGSTVGSTKLREKAAEIIHVACKYILEKRSDDNILKVLVIRIMGTLGNYGSMEYDEWTNHRQTSKLESAITEPSINFIVSTHSKGKRRPWFALIDKTSLHSIWRSSQSSYHMFRTNGNLVPPEHVNLLVDDLLNISSHSYNNLRILAGKYLLNMIKRWPCLVSKCILSHTENLRNPKAPEYSVLGSCEILASQTVLKHLAMDPKSLSSFILGILSSSHHESLKTQKAINQLFYKFNVHFSGVPRSYFKTSKIHGDAPDFAELVSQINYMSLDSVGLHWRYNLMANRVLLLLAMASRNDPNSSKFLSETAGHFLKNLKSQFPQTRILAISALNTLLKESPYKLSDKKQSCSSGNLHRDRKSSLEGELTQIFQEDGFFSVTLNSLSHVHVISGTENSSRVIGNLSFQFLADKSITNFYFDFTSSWPRTPTWVSLFGGDAFYSNYARIFKRLLQECGMDVLATLKSSLEEFSDAKERSKQCVAAEAFAGILHSDIDGISETWNDWMMVRLQKIILAQSVESIPEWTACIRYAITGKGKHGTTVPLLRQPVLDCLAAPLPATVTTTVVVKRYAFLSAALGELSPQKMPSSEIKLHYRLLEELRGNMCHSSAQSFDHDGSHENANKGLGNQFNGRSWILFLKEQSSEVTLNILNITQPDDLETSKNGHLNGDSQADIKWMETLFHFIISSLTSARSSYLVDVIVGFLHPVISLQETSSKELSTLAKAAFELLKWRVFGGPNLQEAISVILSSANDPNWRTRSATLTFLRSFMFRHTFVLSIGEKQQIWRTVEKLLVDNKVEVREHAAAVLAGLTKGVDEDLAKDFREKSYKEAIDLQRKRKQIDLGSSQQIASVHGAVLALVASVLSTPYDMPSWLPDHVTLLARFAGEPTPVKSTVTKIVAEFRRTHADTWNIQKVSFTEEQLEVLADTSSSSSYFA